MIVQILMITSLIGQCLAGYAEYARRAEMETRRRDEPHPWNDVCMDIYETEKCVKLRSQYGFCHEYYMDVLCKKTCGYCKMHGGIDCKDSVFGCCADKTTPRKDVIGTNCPACKDTHEDLCERYQSDCNASGFVGSWMHMNCRKKCGICTDAPEVVCLDSEKQKTFCPLWKKIGICEKAKFLMQAQCRKTCGFCE